ncbi:rhomboid family intramembrane serine protease [Actinacidiphila sp. bgisy160]|uniref:rhomboid family intramembrane serine protease n=1 Tax=Actinacidiphila sp. bgisy160 TaxID=3413796 RepID=UPI003D71DDD2
MTDQAVRCYRHPDRETGIRCSRCERPICPECMINASVGFHCPECVREGRRAAQAAEPRTVAGGSVAGDPRLVTKILIGLNLLVFLLVQVLGPRLAYDLALVGRACNGLGQCVGVAEGPSQWYRLLSSVFLHQEIWHIAFNMLSLWWIGGPLETLLGRSRYLALYLISGLGGSALVVLLAAPAAGSLGASGAIYGLFGAMAVFVKRLRMDMRPVLILLGLNLLFTFTWANISREAHIGGLVTGAVIAVAMAYAPRSHRALVQWGTCAVMLLAVAVTVWAGVADISG